MTASATEWNLRPRVHATLRRVAAMARGRHERAKMDASTPIREVLPPDAATLEAFAAELDGIERRTRAKIGADDLEYMVRIDRTARRLVWVGRALIHVSVEPITWGVGILALTAGKQLNLIEVCHAVLHGTYDRFDHPRIHSERIRSESPMGEATWIRIHTRHHAYTNVAGRDPDARFGVLRQNEFVPYKWYHRAQLLPFASSLVGMMGQLQLMYSGVADFYTRDADESDVLRDRSLKGVLSAHREYLRKAAPYYLKDFVLIPALAGPFFAKVLLANVCAEALKNLYTAFTSWPGHVSENHVAFPKGTRARSKGEWYWMQAVACANFEVPRILSQFSGALDVHIVHHLFPNLPNERIREIEPEVRAICERYGVPYKSTSWPKLLGSLFRQFVAMSRPPSNEPRSGVSRRIERRPAGALVGAPV